MTKKNYSKFWYLFTYSIKKRIKTKSFLISNIIILLAVLVLTNISSIIKLFGGDFNSVTKIYLYDDSGKKAGDELKVYFEDGAYKGTMEIVMPDKEFSESVKDEYINDGVVLVLSTNQKGLIKADVYSKDLSSTDEITLQNVLSEVRNKIWLSEHEDIKQDLTEFMEPLDISNHRQEEDMGAIERTILMVVGMVLLIPVFFLVIILVQFVGVDIIEEKSSRSIEVIISNVPSGQHFASKVLSAIVFVICQGLLVCLYGLIGFGILILTSGMDTSMGVSTGISTQIGIDQTIIANVFTKIPSIVVISFLFVAAGFFMYSIMIAVLSSMSTTMEDFQTFQTPLMLILLAGFYLGIFGIQFQGSIFIKIMGFIPVLSPMLAPLLFVTGEFGVLEAVISLVILIIFDVILFIFGMPLYKVSILSYSQDPFFKRIKKLIKKSKYAK